MVHSVALFLKPYMEFQNKRGGVKTSGGFSQNLLSIWYVRNRLFQLFQFGTTYMVFQNQSQKNVYCMGFYQHTM